MIRAKTSMENYASLPKYYPLHNDSQGNKHRKRQILETTPNIKDELEPISKKISSPDLESHSYK